MTDCKFCGLCREIWNISISTQFLLLQRETWFAVWVHLRPPTALLYQKPHHSGSAAQHGMGISSVGKLIISETKRHYRHSSTGSVLWVNSYTVKQSQIVVTKEESNTAGWAWWETENKRIRRVAWCCVIMWHLHPTPLMEIFEKGKTIHLCVCVFVFV